ncbi:hypothetical protein FV226_27120 [Methylobacterium sp. WL12]|nr:hypothetical protein FV226_27120 [Methylobacterium sp. WL12]
MMSKIAAFRALLTRARTAAPAPVSDAETDMKGALDELRDAERAVEMAENTYSLNLLSADEARLAELDEARRAARRRWDRAQLLMSTCADRLTVAREAEARAELAETVETAVAAQAAYRELVERELPQMSAKARAIHAAKAEAETATKAANAAIAEAGEGVPLPHVEAWRGLAPLPREEIRREVREFWCNSAGDPAPHQSEITTGSDGAGSLRLPGASYLHRFTLRRAFEVVEHLPAEPGVQPPGLDISLAVPELYATAPARDRVPVTSMRPHGPAVEVTRAAPSRSDRLAMGLRA